MKERDIIKQELNELRNELVELGKVMQALFKTYDSWTLHEQEQMNRMKDEEWELEKEIMEKEKCLRM